MSEKIDYLDPNISNGDEKISSKELRQLEYLQKVEISKLHQDTTHDLKQLYDILVKQKEAYDRRKKKSEYIVRLERDVLNKLKNVILWKHGSKIRQHPSIDTQLLFSFESNNKLNQKITLKDINQKILTLFKNHRKTKITVKDINHFFLYYYQALYNELFDSSWDINKKLIPVIKDYFLYRKKWERIFENNLNLVLEKNVSRRLPIIGYIESYFWNNNWNRIAKGPFQFTADSWVTYGLVERKKWILVSDYRNDPIKAADAASKHLRDIFIYRLIDSKKIQESDVLEYEKLLIKPGDTFVKLSEKYDTNIRLIRWFNTLKWNKVDKLVAWKYLYIPTKLNNLVDKIDNDDLFFVLSMYNGGLLSRLKTKPKTVLDYVNILKNIYLDFVYIIRSAKSSNQLRKSILWLNRKYFKKGKWLFISKTSFIRKLQKKSLRYKKKFMLRHIRTIVLQQFGYFWKFLGAVKLLQEIENKKELLKKYQLREAKDIFKLNLFKDDLYQYLPNKCVSFDFWDKGYGSVCINSPWFTFEKLLQTADGLFQVMNVKDNILIRDKKYIVRKGDSLWKVWKKFELDKKWITLQQFIDFNQLSSQVLRVGQIIYIPKEKYELLSKLSLHKKQKALEEKILELLKRNYVVRTYDVIENTKPAKLIYLFK